MLERGMTPSRFFSSQLAALSLLLPWSVPLSSPAVDSLMPTVKHTISVPHAMVRLKVMRTSVRIVISTFESAVQNSMIVSNAMPQSLRCSNIVHIAESSRISVPITHAVSVNSSHFPLKWKLNQRTRKKMKMRLFAVTKALTSTPGPLASTRNNGKVNGMRISQKQRRFSMPKRWHASPWKRPLPLKKSKPMIQ